MLPQAARGPSYNVPMRFTTALLALTCAAASWADTLTLRDGKVVQGTYMGGTARTIKMQVEDEVKTYDVTDVARLEFTAPAPAASSSGTGAGGRHAAKSKTADHI